MKTTLENQPLKTSPWYAYVIHRFPFFAFCCFFQRQILHALNSVVEDMHLLQEQHTVLTRVFMSGERSEQKSNSTGKVQLV